MQHFSTRGNAAYKFFKTFRANPAWAKCVSRDRGGGGGGGGEYFREDRQHIACDNNEPQADIIINESNIDNMNYLWKLTINASENVLLFTEY